ncbi:MAG: polysaccharide biosynthesis/export family protein [Pseudomonadota bacterium]
MRSRFPVLLVAAWVWAAPAGADEPSAPANADEPSAPAPVTGEGPGVLGDDLPPSPAPPDPAPPPVRKALYRVGGGDSVAIQVYGEAALSGTYPVSSSGELDFPLLGVIRVDGLTTAQISALLRERLTQGFLNNPYVTVSVSTYASQPVQVLGAVSKPGLYFLQGPTTVLQILSIAGGVKSEGVDEVRVTHGGEEGDTVVLPYERLLSQGVDSLNLTAGDVVFVPQSLVSVMGSVSKPGEITFREGLTLTRAIAAAGGAEATANLRKVFVLRGEARLRVNVRKVLDGKEPDPPLLAGDRVVVKESVF